MVYLPKILLAAGVALALAFTISCSGDDLDDLFSLSSSGVSSSSSSDAGTSNLSSSSEVGQSSSSEAEQSINCLFRNYGHNTWYCHTPHDEYGEAECAAILAANEAEAAHEGYYFDADYVVVPSCAGYSEYPETMPIGSAGVGCLLRDMGYGLYKCMTVSQENKCSDDFLGYGISYDAINSCVDYTTEEWQPLHGCLIFNSDGEEATCEPVPSEDYCREKWFIYDWVEYIELIDSCEGHGVG